MATVGVKGVKLNKLKPDNLFIGKPSQNYAINVVKP